MRTTSPTSSSSLSLGLAPAGTVTANLMDYSTLTRAVAVAESMSPTNVLAEIANTVANEIYAEAVEAWGIVRANDHVREGCLLARHGHGVVPR